MKRFKIIPDITAKIINIDVDQIVAYYSEKSAEGIPVTVLMLSGGFVVKTNVPKSEIDSYFL